MYFSWFKWITYVDTLQTLTDFLGCHFVLRSGRQAFKKSWVCMHHQKQSLCHWTVSLCCIGLFLSLGYAALQGARRRSQIYARRSQIYTMSRQKLVNRWGSAVWCLSLQIMNSCVFTSYHFPRSGDERAKPAVYQGTHTLPTAITLVEICPMSLFSVVWGSIDSR